MFTRRRHQLFFGSNMGRLKVAIIILCCVSGLQILLHKRTLSSSSLSSSSKVPKALTPSSFDERKVALPHSPADDAYALDGVISKKYDTHRNQAMRISPAEEELSTTTLTRKRQRPPDEEENNKVATSAAILLSKAKKPIKIRAVTGGHLPLSRLHDYADPSTWAAIDNETCRGGGGGGGGYHHQHQSADSSPPSLQQQQQQPLYKWQRRAPYAMVLGTMKGTF